MVIFENGDGAVVMTNSWGGQILVGEILRSIADEYRWPDRQARIKTVIAADPQALDRLVGTYQFTPQFAIRVARRAIACSATRRGRSVASSSPRAIAPSSSRWLMRCYRSMVTAKLQRRS